MNLTYRSNKLYVVKTLPLHIYSDAPKPEDSKMYQSALSNPENLLEVGNQNAAKEDIMIHHNMPVLVEDVIYSLPDDQFLSKVTGCGGGCKNFNDAESLLLCHDHGCQHKVAIISEVTPKADIIIPNVMTDKNKIISRAMTYLSEEDGIGKEIFNELATIMDKEVTPKEESQDTDTNFGLTENQLKVIKTYTSRWEGAEFDRGTWVKIGNKIGLDSLSACLLYFRKMKVIK